MKDKKHWQFLTIVLLKSCVTKELVITFIDNLTLLAKTIERDVIEY